MKHLSIRSTMIIVIVLLHFTLKAQVVFNNAYGGNGLDYLLHVRPTTDNGFILAGESNSDISQHKSQESNLCSDFWIVKINNAGNVQWDITIKDGSNPAFFDFNDIIETSDGYLAILNSLSNKDARIIKLNKSGEIVWDKKLGGPGNDFLKTALETDNGYIFIGASSSELMQICDSEPSDNLDYWILKTSKDGRVLWSRNIGSNGDDNALSIKQTSTGFNIIGQSSSTGKDKQVEGRIWVVSIDENGNLQSQLTAQEGPIATNDNIIYSSILEKLQFTNEGFISVTKILKNNLWSFLIQKFDNQGNLQFEKQYTEEENDNTPFQVHFGFHATENGYLICSFPFDTQNILLFKTDLNGNEIQRTNFDLHTLPTSVYEIEGEIFIGGIGAGLENTKEDPCRSGADFPQASGDFNFIKLIVEQPISENVANINTGGNEITLNNVKWSSDQYFSGSTKTFSNNQPIANTDLDPLYHTERYGKNFAYNIPLPNGMYKIKLHFAETILHFKKGTRVFNVSIENNQVLSNYDIFADVGSATASVKTFDIPVNDNTLNINFNAVVENAKICAIEIIKTENSQASGGCMVYPNPIEHNVNVTLNNDYIGNVNIRLINEAGYQIFSVSDFKSSKDFSTQIPVNLKSGFYFIEIISDTKQVKTLIKP